MTKVHAPYHFVPLSKWVYMPDWAHLVSHDLPFKDGYSGIIEYTLTNVTPLCVGSEVDSKNVLRFARNPDQEPIIPGSSLKGMIRNVLEIASFGKFNSVDNKRFSYRDLSSTSYYLSEVIGKNKIIAGWIKYNQDNNKWQFAKCQYAKVEHADLLNIKKDEIKNSQSAKDKYKLFPLNQRYTANLPENEGDFISHLGSGNVLGHLVFTNYRVVGKGNSSDYEFSYFFSVPTNSITFDDIGNQVTDLFTNNNKNQVDYLKENNNQEIGIPVFALITNNGNLHSLGFAKLPRVSYKYNIHDLIKKHNEAHLSDASFDMAELMFGTLRDKGFGLKSRVSFSDACLEPDIKLDQDTYEADPVILSSPKATFLGSYIEQDNISSYNSYEKNTSKLSGWKRYPIRKKYETNNPKEDKNSSKTNDEIQSKFELLPADNKFNGKIIFHNLKAEELAALIWCLTLEDNDLNYHSLGHAKPLGAGAVQIKINTNTSKLRANLDDEFKSFDIKMLVTKFKEHMNNQYKSPIKWEDSAQIKYLMALTDTDIENYNTFKYLDLEKYKTIKNNKTALPQLEYCGRKLDRTEKIIPSSDSLAFCKGRLKHLFDDDAELEPYDKKLKLLKLISKDQDKLNKTIKKEKIKEIRTITREIKQMQLTIEQRSALLDAYRKINFGQKETKKAIVFLEKPKS